MVFGSYGDLGIQKGLLRKRLRSQGFRTKGATATVAIRVARGVTIGVLSSYSIGGH